jgi:hypothetical protein
LIRKARLQRRAFLFRQLFQMRKSLDSQHPRAETSSHAARRILQNQLPCHATTGMDSHVRFPTGAKILF